MNCSSSGSVMIAPWIIVARAPARAAGTRSLSRGLLRDRRLRSARARGWRSVQARLHCSRAAAFLLGEQRALGPWRFVAWIAAVDARDHAHREQPRLALADANDKHGLRRRHVGVRLDSHL